MFYLKTLILSILITSTIYTQDDSTQIIYNPPPPDTQCDTSSIISSFVSKWMQQHNESLLLILDSLVTAIFDAPEAKRLKTKFSLQDKTLQKTADLRTKAIIDLLNQIISETQ